MNLFFNIIILINELTRINYNNNFNIISANNNRYYKEIKLKISINHIS